jgi:hypothetical protein
VAHARQHACWHVRASGEARALEKLDMESAQGIHPLHVTAHGSNRAVGVQPSQHQVPVEELLTAAFIARHTRFNSANTFLSASGLEPGTLRDLQAQSRFDFDHFVRATSDFLSWDCMLRAARGEWLVRRIGIVIDT